jgi:hypothetical protein
MKDRKHVKSELQIRPSGTVSPEEKAITPKAEGLLWPSTEDQAAMKMENVSRLLETMGSYAP